MYIYIYSLLAIPYFAGALDELQNSSTAPAQSTFADAVQMQHLQQASLINQVPSPAVCMTYS